VSPNDIMEIIVLGVVGTVSIVGISVAGWVYNTRLKIKNGYPLESMWGKPMHPQLTSEANERVKLVTQENAQLRAEVAATKDRLAVVERIVTDSGYQLGHEIDRLRDKEKIQ